MRREHAVILLLIAVVLLPMWYVALTSGTEGGGIAIDESVSAPAAR